MRIKSSELQLVVPFLLVTLIAGDRAIAQSVLLNPAGTQVVSQPAGTTLNVNTLNNVSSSSQYNWTRFPSGSLSAGVQATVTLSPCPVGIDVTPNPQAPMWTMNTAYSIGNFVLDSNGNIEVAIVSGTSTMGMSPSWNTAQWNITNDNTVVWVNYGRVWFPYYVYIAGTGTAEAAVITGGSCTSGATSGTVIFTPANSHSAGFTVGSATAGIQEALNAVCGKTNPVDTGYANDSCRIVIPPNNQTATVRYNIYSTIYVHASHVELYGYGANLDCFTRGPCMQLGDYLNSNHYPDVTVEGLAFRNPQNISTLSSAFQGVQITKTQRTSNVITITTAGPHTFSVGDLVSILATDDTGYWGDFIVASVGTSNTFTVIKAGPIKLAANDAWSCSVTIRCYSRQLVELALCRRSEQLYV